MRPLALRTAAAGLGAVLVAGLASPAHAATSVTVTDKQHDARHGGAYAGASVAYRKLPELRGFTVRRTSDAGGLTVVIRFGEVLPRASRSYDQSFELDGLLEGRLDLTVSGSRNQRKTEVDIGAATADWCAAPVSWDLSRNTASFTVRKSCFDGRTKVDNLAVSTSAERPRTYRQIGSDYARAPGRDSVDLGPTSGGGPAA